MDYLPNGDIPNRIGWPLVALSGLLPALLGLAFDLWG